MRTSYHNTPPPRLASVTFDWDWCGFAQWADCDLFSWYTPQMKLLCLALLFSLGIFGQDDAPAGSRTTTPTTPPPPGREQARSMIVTKFGIVASSQFLASQAGAKMLEAGGNPIHAAIAANSLL